LRSKAVPKRNPTGGKILIKIISFIKELSGLWIPFNQKVIRANSIPGHRRVWIGTDQFMSNII